MIYYEKDGKHPPGDVLVRLAAAFDLPVETLMGSELVPTRRTAHEPDLLNDGEDRRFWKKFKKLRDLSQRDQASVLRMLDALAKTKSAS